MAATRHAPSCRVSGDPMATGAHKKRTPEQQREKMRLYMRTRRASRRASHIQVTSHDHIVKASIYDIGRRELRDGSGAKMWPNRAIGDPAAALEEVAAALRRVTSK